MIEADGPYGPTQTLRDDTPVIVASGLCERAFVPAWVPALLRIPFFIPQLVTVPKVYMPDEAMA